MEEDTENPEDLQLDMGGEADAFMELLNHENLGPIIMSAAGLDFTDFNYSFGPGMPPVPLQDFVDHLRNFDQNNNEFRLTFEGVDLEEQGVGALWYFFNNDRKNPPNRYFLNRNMARASQTGNDFVHDGVNEINAGLQQFAQQHGQAEPIFTVRASHVHMFTIDNWAQAYHRDHGHFEGHRRSILNGEGIVSINMGGVSTITFKYTDENEDTWEFEFPRGWASYSYMSPLARTFRHAITYDDGRAAAAAAQQQQPQPPAAQPPPPQQQQPQPPAAQPPPPQQQQQQQGQQQQGQQQQQQQRGVSIVYLFNLKVRDDWRDAGADWMRSAVRIFVAYLMNYWLDRQYQRPQQGGGGGGGGGGDDDNAVERLPLADLPESAFNPPSRDVIERLPPHRRNPLTHAQGRERDNRRARERQRHEERLNDALGRADDGERPCHSCYEIKNAVEDFTGDNVWCDECIRRVRKRHEERFNDALGRADDGERPCSECCVIKNAVEDFTGDNVKCDECSDKNRLYQRKRRKCFESLRQEEEATQPSPYPSTFTPRDIVADGNCQFRAIADQLYDNQNRHREVREAVIRELESNRTRYIGLLIHLRSVEGNQSEDADILWNTYIDELCRGPISDTSLGWGDNITLFAAANALGVDIRVFGRSVGPSGILIKGVRRTANSVGMLNIFRDGHHYLSLREEEEDFKEEEATQPSPYPSTFTPRDIVADGNCQFRAIAGSIVRQPESPP